MSKKSTNNIIKLGILNPMSSNKIHERNWVYSTKGLMCTLSATDYKDPRRILVWKK